MIQHQHNIVAICGPSSSGKSTLAEFLEREHKYIRTSFAYPIKKMLTEFVTLQGCDYDIVIRMFYGDLKHTPSEYLSGRTPVYAMQTLGTEWGRDLMHPNLWINAWKKNVSKLSDKYNIAIDDLRFLSEEKILRTFENALIVRITRHGYDTGEHQSESEYPEIKYDTIIYNDSTPEEMFNELKRNISSSTFSLSQDG